MFQMQFFYYTIRIVGWQTDSMRRFFAECALKGIPGLFSGNPRKGQDGLDGDAAAGASLTERKGRAPLSHAAGERSVKAPGSRRYRGATTRKLIHVASCVLKSGQRSIQPFITLAMGNGIYDTSTGRCAGSRSCRGFVSHDATVSQIKRGGGANERKGGFRCRKGSSRWACVFWVSR